MPSLRLRHRRSPTSELVLSATILGDPTPLALVNSGDHHLYRCATYPMPDPAQTLRDFAFADGQYLAHFTDGDTCVMDYRNWREELYRFVFTGVALVRAYGGSVSLCDAFIANDSPLITETRQVLADDWGTSGGPEGITLTELTISDDVPVFTIIFTHVRIIGPIHPDNRMVMGT